MSRDIEKYHLVRRVLQSLESTASAPGLFLQRLSDCIGSDVSLLFACCEKTGQIRTVEAASGEAAAKHAEDDLHFPAMRDALLTGTSVWGPDDAGRSCAAVSLPEARGIHSVLVVPIRFNDGTVGMIYMDRRRSASPFTDVDRECLECISPVIRALYFSNPGSSSHRCASLEMMLDARRIAAALVGESEGFLQSLTLLNSAARCSVPVLLTGEPGTGKNLFARAIHTLRTGNSVPFVTVDGSAATAADLSRGSPHTLYLKRPELLSAGSRALLRQVVTRVSGTVNVIASSESEPAVTGGPHSERGGPFDGIETVCIRLPPLRERSVDVRPLSEYFFRKHSAQLGFCRLDVRPEVHIVLQAQTYGSGNVRELENVVRDSLQRSENGTVTLACLPQHIRPGTVRDAEQNPFSGLARSTPATYGELSALRREIRRICRAEISSAEGRFAVALLASTGGNVSRAARLAGVDRGLFHRLLKRR